MVLWLVRVRGLSDMGSRLQSGQAVHRRCSRGTSRCAGRDRRTSAGATCTPASWTSPPSPRRRTSSAPWACRAPSARSATRPTSSRAPRCAEHARLAQTALMGTNREDQHRPTNARNAVGTDGSQIADSIEEPPTHLDVHLPALAPRSRRCPGRAPAATRTSTRRRASRTPRACPRAGCARPRRQRFCLGLIHSVGSA